MTVPDRGHDVPLYEPASELARLACKFARGAGELALESQRQHLSIATKSSLTDLVTDADRRVERWLVAAIGAARPYDAVLGEEGGARAGASNVRWVIDPIDGTVNFVLGLPQFAVSVAAEIAGDVVAAAVYNPTSGELFHAERGGGAFLGDGRLHDHRAVPLGQAVIGTGFGYDSARRARQIAVVARLLPQIADIRRMGAASLDLCAVAAGRLDGYFEAGLSPWDFAAGVLIAREAGCVATGLAGRPPSEQLTVVAHPELAHQFCALLSQLGADRVTQPE